MCTRIYRTRYIYTAHEQYMCTFTHKNLHINALKAAHAYDMLTDTYICTQPYNMHTCITYIYIQSIRAHMKKTYMHIHVKNITKHAHAYAFQIHIYANICI